MDPAKVTPDHLSIEQIWEIVENFRTTHIGNEDIPVDIEAIIQSNLGIDVIPVESIQVLLGMDGFISLDFKNIYVDNRLYITDAYYPRVRFTIAHEIGHYVLHRSFIDQLKIESIEEWKKFRQSINAASLRWFEYQANEFAGRLLVPIDRLIALFRTERERIIKDQSWNEELTLDEIMEVAAMSISSKFSVSKDVIFIRLQKDKVKSILGLK